MSAQESRVGFPNVQTNANKLVDIKGSLKSTSIIIMMSEWDVMAYTVLPLALSVGQ